MDSIAKTVFKVSSMKLYSIPASLAISVLLARYLGPQDFGEYAFILSLVSILSIPVGSGLSSLVTREIAAFHYLEKWAYYRGFLTAAFFWVLAFTFFVYLVLIVFKLLKVSFVETYLSNYLYEIMALISFVGLTAVGAGALRGLGLPAQAEMPLQLAAPTFKILIIALTVWLFGVISVSGSILIHLLTTLFATIIVVGFLYRAGPTVGWDRRYKINYWAKSLWPFIIISAMNIMNAELGIIAVGIMSGAEQVAGLRIAERIGQFVLLPLTIINMIIAPYLVRAFKDNDHLMMQTITSRSTGWAFMISMPIGVMLIFFGSFLINIIFGAEYSGLADGPMVAIILAQLVSVFFGPVGYLLLLTENEMVVLKIQFTALVCGIVIMGLLIPNYGAVGAASAYAFSTVVWNCGMAFSVFKMLRINPFFFKSYSN